MEAAIDQIVQVLGAALGVALVALAVKALQWIGITIDAEKQAKLEYYAEQGINRAEEWAAQQAKKSLGVVRVDSEEKLQIALDHVKEHVPKVAVEKALATIEAKLGDPAVAAGATDSPKVLWTPQASQ